MVSILTASLNNQSKFRGHSPGANYTDRATVACRISAYFEDRGCHVVCATEQFILPTEMRVGD
jgi:hypothetical protein